MNVLVACFLFAVLTGIAAVHAFWAFGGCWPAKSRDNLPRMVVGTEAKEMPSNTLTLIVAVLIFTVGVVPIFWMNLLSFPLDRGLLAILLPILAMIFLIRGFVTYTPISAKYSVVEPFATLNRYYYSPLCLAIGAGFLLVRFA